MLVRMLAGGCLEQPKAVREGSLNLVGCGTCAARQTRTNMRRIAPAFHVERQEAARGPWWPGEAGTDHT